MTQANLTETLQTPFQHPETSTLVRRFIQVPSLQCSLR
jgi:hypothetical protein